MSVIPIDECVDTRSLAMRLMDSGVIEGTLWHVKARESGETKFVFLISKTENPDEVQSMVFALAGKEILSGSDFLKFVNEGQLIRAT